MTVKLLCGALHGVDAFRVDLEVSLIKQGLPSFVMVGLAEGAVREAKERVFAALHSSGFKIPPAKITVNLAPADRKKAGSGYDLPLAIGLLASVGVISIEATVGWYICGELSLTGEVKPISGILPLALLARAKKAKGIIVPYENGAEAGYVEGIKAIGVKRLQEVVEFLSGKKSLSPMKHKCFLGNKPQDHLDFSDVKGQEHAKRAIEIAAAGGHNLLLIGPPGTGKTMLAKRVPSVLPQLTFEESLEVTKIYSVSGLLKEKSVIQERPFRAPHHTISEIALVGGGISPKPGEISLAHNGVLFLDELPEYAKGSLEVLRQPLEEGVISVSRAAYTAVFPASCMLIAAMNPCPCGYSTDPQRLCVCSVQQIQKYRAKLSGPLLDRIDLHIEVPPVSYDDLRTASGQRWSSSQIKDRVIKARLIQKERYKGNNFYTNAALSGKEFEKYCSLEHEAQDFLRNAVQQLSLSARAYTRILRVSRTIADLDCAEKISIAYLAEAIGCRSLDRGYV